MMAEQEIRRVPEYKKKIVEDLSKKISDSRTVLVASIKGLPGSQFQLIKKKLRGTAEITVAKKSAILRAISSVDKGALQNLKEQIVADTALIFSDKDAFELSGMLTENQSPARAKAGDIAPEDINIEPGPTDLMPGPAISELSGVGLKVAVEGGKLAIKQGATIVKEGEVIDEKVASVLGKLGVSPMKVGLIPLAAYDSSSDKTYVGIKIDKEGTLKELRDSIGRALGFAVNVKYVVKETISYFISKAGIEEKAMEKIISEKSSKPEESKGEEKPAESEKTVKESDEQSQDTNTKEEA